MRPGLITAALSLTATSLLAHSKAEQTTPANGDTVEAVEMIELRFDAPMRVTAIWLSGPDGEVGITRQTGLDPVTAFRATPQGALPAGAYIVDWRGLASDGHPMNGTFGFTVAD